MTLAARVVDVARLPESELVDLARARDPRALEAIMRRHNRTLFRTARAILRDDAEAEDAVQEAYLRAFAAIGDFRGDSRLGTWLVRIAANEALMRRRAAARKAGVVPIGAERAAAIEEEPMAEDSGPEQDAQRAELRRLLERRIDALPDDYRAVFVLRALEELSVEETAAALGIPEATVRTRHFRARALLRESLAQEIDRNLDAAFSFAGNRCDRLVANVLRRLAAGT